MSPQCHGRQGRHWSRPGRPSTPRPARLQSPSARAKRHVLGVRSVRHSLTIIIGRLAQPTSCSLSLSLSLTGQALAWHHAAAGVTDSDGGGQHIRPTAREPQPGTRSPAQPVLDRPPGCRQVLPGFNQCRMRAWHMQAGREVVCWWWWGRRQRDEAPPSPLAVFLSLLSPSAAITDACGRHIPHMQASASRCHPRSSRRAPHRQPQQPRRVRTSGGADRRRRVSQTSGAKSTTPPC